MEKQTALDSAISDNYRKSCLDTVNGIAKVYGGISGCKVATLLAMLKLLLQQWAAAGCQLNDQSYKCARLTEAVITISVDQSCHEKLSEEHVKVIIYAASNVIKMIERPRMIGFLSRISLLIKTKMELTGEIARLCGHFIQLLAQHCSKYGPSESIPSTDVAEIVDMMKLSLSSASLAALKMAIPFEQAVQLHQFQLDVIASFSLRTDVIINSLTKPLVDLLVSRYEDQVFPGSIKLSKFIEVVYRQLMIAQQSSLDPLKSECTMLLQRIISLCSSKSASANCLTAAELLKLLQCTLDMVPGPHCATLFRDIGVIARQLDAKMVMIVVSLLNEEGPCADDVHSMEFECLPSNCSLVWDVLTKATIHTCFNSISNLRVDKALKLLVSQISKYHTTNGNSSTSTSIVNIVAKVAIQRVSLCKQSGFSDNSNFSGCIRLSTLIAALLSDAVIWNCSETMALGLMKTLGNCLTCIPADDFSRLPDNTVDIFAERFLQLARSFESFKSYSATVLQELSACMLSILQFLMPRLVGKGCTNLAAVLFVSLCRPLEAIYGDTCSLVSNCHMSAATDTNHIDTIIKFLQTTAHLIVSTLVNPPNKSSPVTTSADIHPAVSLFEQLGTGNFTAYIQLQFVIDASAKLQEARVLSQVDEEFVLDVVEKIISIIPERILGTFEKDVLCLDFISNSLLLKDLSTSDEKSKGLIEQLNLLAARCIGSEVGVDDVVRVANKKPHAMQAKAGLGKSQQIRSIPVVAMSIKVWSMLIKWTQPAVSSCMNTRSDDDNGNRTSGARLSHYLTSAMNAMRELGKLIESKSLSDESRINRGHMLLNNYVPVEARFLFHALGLHGRLSDQVELLKILNNVAVLEPDATNLKSLSRELQLCSAMQHALLGNYSWRPNHQNKRLPLLSSDMLPDNVTAYLKGLQMNTDINNDWSNAMLKIICKAYEAMTNQSSTDFDELGNELVAQLESRLKGKNDRNQTIENLRILRVWVTLLVATGHLVASGDHKRSLIWSRRLISLTFHNGSQRIPLELIRLRLEGLLLTSEIYEQCGLIDNSLSYLSEAIATAKLASQASMSIVGLHGLRIWYRLDSSRLLASMSDLLGLSEPTSSTTTVQLDNVSAAVRFIVVHLAKLLAINLEEDVLLPGANASVDWISYSIPIDQCLQFRYLGRYWNTDLTIAPSANEVNSFRKYDTCMRKADKAAIRAINDSLTFRITDATIRVSSLADADRSHHVLKHRNEQMAGDESMCFDVTRDLRRYRNLVNITQTSENSDPMLAFILGASSCNVSAENLVSLESSLSESNSSTARSMQPISNPLKYLNVSSALIRDALSSSNVDALSKMHNLLGSMMLPWPASAEFGMSQQFVSGICYLAIEPFTNNLLIGRYESQAVFTAVLPIADKLRSFLKDWKELMEESDRVLQRTKDVKQVKKWSEADKQQWWDDRSACDQAIAKLLRSFEEILGPYRCMLMPCSLGGQFSDDMPALAAEVNPMVAKKGSSAKRSRVGVRVPDVQELLRQPNIAAWTRLVVESMNESSSRSPLTREEALVAIKGVLSPELPNILDISEQLLSHCLQSASFLMQPAYNNDNKDSDHSATHPSQSLKESSEASDDLDGLKITDLRKLLKDINQPTTGKKDELINRIRDHRNLATQGHISTSRSNQRTFSGGHIVLILDEHLQEIPIECIPLLKSASCSRVPGLAVLLSMIMHRQSQDEAVGLKSVATSDSICIDSHEPSSCPRKVDATKTWYVIDPESNLPETRSTMMKFFEPYTGAWKWTGFASNIPPESVVKRQHEISELFIYCGHGAGEKIINSHKQRKLKTPSALLWGCSSGKLPALGAHDAHGSALNYLLGGALFVVGNLWDVTDRDIDKYSINCMKNVLPAVCGTDEVKHARQPLSVGMATSRSVCKLEYAVGCAPVMYGLPIDISCSPRQPGH